MEVGVHYFAIFKIDESKYTFPSKQESFLGHKFILGGIVFSVVFEKIILQKWMSPI